MPVLQPGRTVRSAQPTLLVENAFEPGRYVFQLQCVDDAGNVSDPVQITVTVRARRVDRPDIILGDRVIRRDTIIRDTVIRDTPVRPRRPGG